MSDDYLWDKSGPPDPEIVALERALARVDPPVPTAQVVPIRKRWPIAAVALALAAAFVLALGGWWWSLPEPDATPSIANVDDELPTPIGDPPRTPPEQLRREAPAPV